MLHCQSKVIETPVRSQPINLKFVRKVKQNLICKIENILTRTDAEKLRGLKLFINRDNLSKLADDEFYQVDLIGFQVYNLNRESFGSVISFNDFGGGLLVEVKNNNKMFYFPVIRSKLQRYKQGTSSSFFPTSILHFKGNVMWLISSLYSSGSESGN